MNIKRARQILAAIETGIGVDTSSGLVYWGSNDKDIGSWPNSLYGILLARVGDKKGAKKIREAITEEIGYIPGCISGLYYYPTQHPLTIAFPLAGVRRQTSPKDEESRKREVDYSRPNSAFGLLEFSLGNLNEAKIQEGFGYRLAAAPFYDRNGETVLGSTEVCFDDMDYSNRSIFTLDHCKTNLYRWLKYSCLPNKNRKKSSLKDTPDNEDFDGYLVHKILDKFLGLKVDERRVINKIITAGGVMDDNLLRTSSGKALSSANALLGIMYTF